jgi:hypothetical protein
MHSLGERTQVEADDGFFQPALRSGDDGISISWNLILS